jgi:hypothetical protein
MIEIHDALRNAQYAEAGCTPPGFGPAPVVDREHDLRRVFLLILECMPDTPDVRQVRRQVLR